ncbi:MAG: transglutaminase-like domain-containing protein [Lentisphaeria bacterium]
MTNSKLTNQNPGLRIKLLAGLMLVSAALFLGLLADLPHIPIMVCCALLPALLLSHPLRVTDRSVTYSILFAILVATLLGYFFPLERGRLGFFSYFFRPEYYCAFALNIALVSCYFQSRSLIAATCISAVVFVLGTCGDVNSLDYINVRFLWGSDWINSNYHPAYAGMVGLELLLTLLLLKTSRPEAQPGKSPWIARSLAFFSLLLLAGMISLTLYMHQVYEKEIRNLEHSFIAAGGHSLLRHLRRRTEPFFGEDIDLNRPFPFGDPEKERQILLRVIASSPPGYLRSRVFCYYSGGHWTLQENYDPLLLLSEEPEGILAMTRYLREDRKSHSKNRFDLYFSSSLNSDTFPLPTPYARIDLVTDNLAADQEGQLVPTKWKRDAGYTVYTSEDWQPGQAFDLPTNPLLTTRYLQLPDNLISSLEQVRQEIPALNAEQPDRLRCRNLVQYFHRNFTYRLGSFQETIQFRQNDGRASAGSLRRHLRARSKAETLTYRRRLQENPEEPVLYFLQKSQAGHCELFASAAVLLLRQCGIPARYVTGFLCMEKHPSNSYYVSRLGHAHAWVEAFDRQQKKWIQLDPTPPDGLRNFENSWGRMESLTDRLRQIFDQLLADVHRGLMASAVLALLKLLWLLLWNPIGIALLLLTSFAYLRYRSKRRPTELVQLSNQQKQLAKSYKALAKHWGKRLGLEKSHSRTGRELLALAKLNTSVTPQELASLEAEIDAYEKNRFDPENEQK